MITACNKHSNGNHIDSWRWSGEHTRVSNVVNKFNFSIHENFSINEASFSLQGFVCHHCIQLLYMFVHFSCLTIPSVLISVCLSMCIKVRTKCTRRKKVKNKKGKKTEQIKQNIYQSTKKARQMRFVCLPNIFLGKCIFFCQILLQFCWHSVCNECGRNQHDQV